MLIGLYTDPHINKKVRFIEQEFKEALIKSFETMYRNFLALGVDKVLCLGDFFDQPQLAAKDVEVFSKIMRIASLYDVDSYYLLGNHEIFDQDNHMLKLVETYPKQHIYDTYTIEDDCVYIPYSVNPAELDPDDFKDKIIFSHHDVCGSLISGGANTANFGIAPSIFKNAKRVLNGHLHMRSQVGKITNIGSLFTTQFGELIEGDFTDHPSYYVYDTKKDELKPFINMHNIDFVTLHPEQYDDYIESVKDSRSKDFKPVVRFLKDSSYQEIEEPSTALYVTYKLRTEDSQIVVNEDQTLVRDSALDVKQLIVEYIEKDDQLNKSSKKRIKKKVKNLLD